MLESDIGKGICTELAAIPNMVYSHDVTPSTGNYPFGITTRELELTPDKYLTLSTETGAPVKPDVQKMLTRTVEIARFGSCAQA